MMPKHQKITVYSGNHRPYRAKLVKDLNPIDTCSVTDGRFIFSLSCSNVKRFYWHSIAGSFVCNSAQIQWSLWIRVGSRFRRITDYLTMGVIENLMGKGVIWSEEDYKRFIGFKKEEIELATVMDNLYHESEDQR